MKFITLVDNFKKSINLAEKITGKNLTLPVLSNIFLKTNKNKLHLLATDLEIGIELIISGKVEKEGKFIIPAKTFSMFLNNLSEEKITIEESKNVLLVKSGNYNTIFQGINPDEFPIIPETKTEKYIEIEKKDFEEALEQVIPSVGYTSPKPELNGVFLKLENKSSKNILKLVGTDSFRLAEKNISSEKIKTNIKDDLEMIIPLRTAQEVLRIIQEEIEEVSSVIKISPEPNQVQFLLNNVRLISRLINAEYPKYSSIIPSNFKNQTILNKKKLIEAVKIVGLFSGRINDVVFDFNPSKKEIIIEAQDPSLGKSHTILIPEDINGDPLKISFNHHFLLDGLYSIKEDEVIIKLNKEINPGLIHGKSDDSFSYILMPIKI
jgi:DNA polymerase-3 subunit beta